MSDSNSDSDSSSGSSILEMEGSNWDIFFGSSKASAVYSTTSESSSPGSSNSESSKSASSASESPVCVSTKSESSISGSSKISSQSNAQTESDNACDGVDRRGWRIRKRLCFDSPRYFPKYSSKSPTSSEDFERRRFLEYTSSSNSSGDYHQLTHHLSPLINKIKNVSYSDDTGKYRSLARNRSASQRARNRTSRYRRAYHSRLRSASSSRSQNRNRSRSPLRENLEKKDSLLPTPVSIEEEPATEPENPILPGVNDHSESN